MGSHRDVRGQGCRRGSSESKVLRQEGGQLAAVEPREVEVGYTALALNHALCGSCTQAALLRMDRQGQRDGRGSP